jgi:hypothetical protein
VSGNLIILEEFAFMNKNCWFEVVIPLLSLKKTATIGITTLAPAADNHVADIMRRKAMPYWSIELVCDTCKRTGKSSTCSHMEYLRPNWQTSERAKIVQKLYPEGDEDKFAREAQGILIAPSNACFDPYLVQELFSSKGHTIDRAQRYLFVTIDPSGGSMKPEHSKSDFALISHVIPGCQIVGMEAIAAKNVTSWETRIVEHIKRCLDSPYMVHAKLIVIVEGNMATEATHAKRMILKHWPTAAFPGNMGPDKTGVHTTNQTKFDAQELFQIALAEDAIRLPRTLITTDPSPNKLIDKLRVQMLKYSYYAKVGKDPLGATRYTFSGKGQSMNDKDDMIQALLMAYMYSQRFFSTTEWLHYHK